MQKNLSINREYTLPHNMQNLVVASECEGYQFVARLSDEWSSGENCFNQDSERFMVASLPVGAVGFGGINQDPYVANEDAVGRLRHVYVLPDYRRGRLGTALVESLIDSAVGNFNVLRLRVADDAGRLFYESMGFIPIVNPSATHVLALK